MHLLPFVVPVSVYMALMIGSGLGGVTVLGVWYWQWLHRPRAVPALPDESADRVPCRYCGWGDAIMVEEIVRGGAGGVTDVRCFVCRNCGLPQWTVRPVTVAHSGRYTGD